MGVKESIFGQHDPWLEEMRKPEEQRKREAAYEAAQREREDTQRGLIPKELQILYEDMTSYPREENIQLLILKRLDEISSKLDKLIEDKGSSK